MSTIDGLPSTGSGAADAQLDIREKLAHIDQMLADHDRNREQIEQLQADRDRKRQEIRLAPWQLALAGVTTGAGLMAAGAGLFAAGGVYLKLFGGG